VLLASAVLLALLVCGRAPERAPEPADSSGPVSAQTPSGRTGSPVVLAPEAEEDWRLREIDHVPRYFQLSGWKDASTLFGRAGCNPVEVRVDAAEYVAWDVAACGDAVLAPGGTRLAWGDGQGAIRVGERGGPQRLVFDPATAAPAGEGDPTGLILWSQDGRKILTSRAQEWESSYALIDVASGGITPLSTRLDGYFLTAAAWLDPDRVLFTTQASRALDGTSEYRESGGYRTDLAVYDLRNGAYRRVTAAPDSVHLHPLGRWGDREILVGERGSGRAIERYWAYDTDRWSRRAVDGLPAGTHAVIADSTRVLVVDANGAGADATHTRLLLRDRGTVVPLADIYARPGAIVWSPDGRRLALTTTVEEPAHDAPGGFVTRYVAHLIEPRQTR
jgi:hypothetical protein